VISAATGRAPVRPSVGSPPAHHLPPHLVTHALRVAVWLVAVALGPALSRPVAGGTAQPTSGAADGPCTPATNRFARSTQQYAAYFAADSDSLAVAARQAWGLAPVPASEITVVRDSVACARGLRLHQRSYPATRGYLDRVVVVRMGHLRAVTREPDDPTRVGHQPMVVTDSTVTTVVDVHW
jgi:hypothetical protein